MENNKQTYGEAIGNTQIPFGGDIIRGLLALMNPAQTLASTTKNAAEVFSNTQIGENPIPNMIQSVKTGPYSEGVKKALKESGYAHASEAIQSGIPPEHIEQQAGLTQTQTQQPAQNQPTSQPQQSMSIIQQLLGGSPGGYSMQNGTASYQPPTLLGGLIGRTPEYINAMTNAMQAQPGYILGTEAGKRALPMSTYEQASIQGKVAENQINAIKAEADLNESAQKNITDLIGQYEKMRGPMNKTLGGPSEEIKGLQKVLNSLQTKRQGLESKIARFKSPNAASGNASNYVKTGMYNGKRVGMTQDGKLEFIK